MGKVLTGAEVTWRRRRLGLNRTDLGAAIMVVSQGKVTAPISESTVTRWEHDKGGAFIYVSAETIRMWFDRLDMLAERIDDSAYALCAKVGAGPDGVAHLTAYRNDAAFHRVFPNLAPLPCSLWNHGVVEALMRLRRENPDRTYVMDWAHLPE
ncbi:hypothetical protein [Bifidobacterium stellenboschense]|uniref:Uncharacterized protein n=1 Tax=Bifidobacterium stellenboschense TaxID=762211 RepID=A0A087DPR3_9BIFI|nr:hypothetical protein [Bifidobacterium stellenboschense]KFI97513.1 hypothetical protein BSTEL_0234 [Bifidobacterium stellenboschense]